jgi:hypothetical protein
MIGVDERPDIRVSADLPRVVNAGIPVNEIYDNFLAADGSQLLR